MTKMLCRHTIYINFVVILVMDMETEQLLRNRGPDAYTTIVINGVEFGGFVLWQQGKYVCEQPIESADTILVFNGDIYNIDDEEKTILSDSAWLANKISECTDDEEIGDLFRGLKGPFSIIFFNKRTNDLYFGRDSLGRNSLLFEKDNSHLRILSTSYNSNINQKTVELPPLGLYKLNTKNLKQCCIYPWNTSNYNYWKFQLESLEKTFDIKFELRKSLDPKWLSSKNISNNSFDFYDICKNYANCTPEIFEKLLSIDNITNELSTFSSLLEESVKARVVTTTQFCKNCILTSKEKCRHAKIGIFYSGGIDCSILAVLVDKYVDLDEPIDLINVCFEKVNSNRVDWSAPDRLSAIESLKELTEICPNRKWNFIEVNVSREHLYANLNAHIRHLIYPLDTVLDESIGCCFWFAGRGEGYIDGHQYISPTRIIIVGSGADELFGGYKRHRNAYNHCHGTHLEKQLAVLDELENDWHRIPSRNLARDDRIVSDSGRTLRAPFIEEDLVRYVRNLSASQRCCFTLAEGFGDKLFLRLYGYKIGLRSTVSFKKRAIQFGSKIANKKQNANDKSTFLQIPLISNS